MILYDHSTFQVLRVYNTMLFYKKEGNVPLQIIFLLYPAIQRKQIPGLPVTSQGSFAVKNRGRAFPWLARFARDAIPVPHCSTKPLSFQNKHKQKRLKHKSSTKISSHMNEVCNEVYQDIFTDSNYTLKGLYAKNHSDNPGKVNKQQI